MCPPRSGRTVRRRYSFSRLRVRQLHDLSLVGQPIAQRIRIVETAEREEIERCVRIRGRLEVRGQLQRILPDSYSQAFPARRGAAPPHTRARAASQLVACQAQSGASATAQSSAKTRAVGCAEPTDEGR